jgi:hypothetical protein
MGKHGSYLGGSTVIRIKQAGETTAQRKSRHLKNKSASTYRADYTIYALECLESGSRPVAPSDKQLQEEIDNSNGVEHWAKRQRKTSEVSLRPQKKTKINTKKNHLNNEEDARIEMLKRRMENPKKR